MKGGDHRSHHHGVPAYTIFDGFNADLNTSMVYERLVDIQDRMPMVDHALTFLRMCMIGGWRL